MKKILFFLCLISSFCVDAHRRRVRKYYRHYKRTEMHKIGDDEYVMTIEEKELKPKR